MNALEARCPVCLDAWWSDRPKALPAVPDGACQIEVMAPSTVARSGSPIVTTASSNPISGQASAIDTLVEQQRQVVAGAWGARGHC